MVRSLVLASCCALFATGCGGVAKSLLRPAKGFSPARAPAAPTYAGARWWAALPDEVDQADRTPSGETDGQAQATAAVFYLHPTTYYSDDNWNQPLADKTANKRVDEALRSDAAVFNGSAKVYAPRYRQATLYTFMDPVDFASTDGAMALAYGDVDAAFTEFLKRIGDAPFFIAGHAQGSYHALRLLATRVSGTPLRARLIAAYLVGVPLPEDVFRRTLPDVPLCTPADQTGCVVTFMTVSRDLDSQAQFRRRLPVYYPDGGYETTAAKKLACTNPLDGPHLGVVRFSDGTARPAPEPVTFGATCVEGLLMVDDLPWKYGQILNGQGDIMLPDYSLFWMNLRQSVGVRVRAFGGSE